MLMLLLQVAVRAALIAAVTACILPALRVRTAAARHAAWTIVLAAMLLLPLWSVAGPAIPLALLPPTVSFLDAGSAANPEAADAAHRARAMPSRPLPIAAVPPSVAGSSRGTLVLTGAYLLGVLALLARLAIGTVHAHRLRRGAVMHAGRATSARCATPVTVGWWSPVLILPDGWERWSAPQIDAVVTHEHAHARRRDPLVQWLALLNRAIFWFHPLAWWLERRLASLAEEVCDAAVIRAGHSPQEYSGYLIDMARALSHNGRRLNVAGASMPGSNLAHRMRRIFEELPMTSLTRTRVICVLAVCTASSIVCAAGILTPRPSAAAHPQGITFSQVKADIASPEPRSNAEASKDDLGVANSQPISGLPAEKTVVALAPAPTNPARPGAISEIPNTLPQAGVDSPRRVEDDAMQVNPPDFSGHWSLVSSTYAGPGRGGSGATGGGGEREVTTKWASGAPVNCGPQCTITQDAKSVTISRLGTPDAVTRYDNGVVVLNLDGSESTVTQASGTQYVVHATWDGDKLIVKYEFAYFTVTQALSIVDDRLKVITDFGVGDAPVTMTYVKG